MDVKQPGYAGYIIKILSTNQMWQWEFPSIWRFAGFPRAMFDYRRATNNHIMAYNRIPWEVYIYIMYLFIYSFIYLFDYLFFHLFIFSSIYIFIWLQI